MAMDATVSNGTLAWVVPCCVALLLAAAGWVGTLIARWGSRITGRFDQLEKRLGQRIDDVDGRVDRHDEIITSQGERIAAAEATLGLRDRPNGRRPS